MVEMVRFSLGNSQLHSFNTPRSAVGGAGLQPCESGSSPEGCDQWREMRNRRPGTQLLTFPIFQYSFNIFDIFSKIVRYFSIFFNGQFFFGSLSAGFHIFDTP